ncbi:AVID protein, partial [Regulus satrapa]|nr:AVID protein [Regulus satrapa]
MVQATPFLLVLCLALGAQGLSEKKCSLTGRWVNDLGSNMTIRAVNANGDFAGTYHTAVTATSNEIKQILVSPLPGAQQHPSAKGHPTLGCTLQGHFSDSTTAFEGQCLVDPRWKEALESTWLLREEILTHKDTWEATR